MITLPLFDIDADTYLRFRLCRQMMMPPLAPLLILPLAMLIIFMLRHTRTKYIIHIAVNGIVTVIHDELATSSPPSTNTTLTPIMPLRLISLHAAAGGYAKKMPPFSLFRAGVDIFATLLRRHFATFVTTPRIRHHEMANEAIHHPRQQQSHHTLHEHSAA